MAWRLLFSWARHAARSKCLYEWRMTINFLFRLIFKQRVKVQNSSCCVSAITIIIKGTVTFFFILLNNNVKERVQRKVHLPNHVCSQIYVDKPIIIFYMLELSRRILREIENLIRRMSRHLYTGCSGRQ